MGVLCQPSAQRVVSQLPHEMGNPTATSRVPPQLISGEAMSERLSNVLTWVGIVLALVVVTRPGSPLAAAYSTWRSAKAARTAFDHHVSAAMTEGQWLGRRDSSRFVVEVSDYECPFCRKAEPVVKTMRSDQTAPAVLYLHYPLPFHPHARPAALAALCADVQGSGLVMHEHLMTTTGWQTNDDWRATARLVGVREVERFVSCMGSQAAEARLNRNIALADSLRVSGTPTFIGVNGRSVGVPAAMVLPRLAR